MSERETCTEDMCEKHGECHCVCPCGDHDGADNCPDCEEATS